MTAPSPSFTDILATLPDIAHLPGVVLTAPDGSTTTLEKRPGQAGSVAVYHALWLTFGEINAEAARQGLAFYAEHTADARQRLGAHPNIDRLLAIAEQAAPTLHCTPILL